MIMLINMLANRHRPREEWVWVDISNYWLVKAVVTLMVQYVPRYTIIFTMTLSWLLLHCFTYKSSQGIKNLEPGLKWERQIIGCIQGYSNFQMKYGIHGSLRWQNWVTHFVISSHEYSATDLTYPSFLVSNCVGMTHLKGCLSIECLSPQ